MSEHDVLRWVNALPAKTGVYCHSHTFARNVFKELLSVLPKGCIQSSICADGLVGITVAGGKTIRFVMPYESTMGFRFDRIYIDGSIENVQHGKLIRQSVTAHCEHEPEVIYGACDMINGGIKASSFFNGKWIICSDGYYPYCSVCGYELPRTFQKYPKICPHCWAEMQNGEGA